MSLLGKIALAVRIDTKEMDKDLKSVSDKLSQMGDRLVRVGRDIDANVSAPIRAFRKDAMDTFMEYEKTFTEIETLMKKQAKNSDELAKNMAEISAEIDRVGVSTQYSVQEIADAFKNYARTGATAQEMTAGMASVAHMATAGQMDLAESTRIMNASLNQFASEGLTAQKVADIMVNTMSSTDTEVSELAKTFEYVGSLAGQAGFQFADIATATGILGDAGLHGSKAGTGLRNVIMGLTTPTEKGAEVMEKLGVQTMDAQGNMRDFTDIIVDMGKAMNDPNFTDQDKMNMAKQLFGRYGANAFLALVSKSESEIRALNDTVANTQGSAEEYSDNIMNTTWGIKKQLEATWSLVKKDIAGQLEIGYKKLLLTGKKVLEWYLNLGEGTKKFIAYTITFLGALAPLIMGLGYLLKFGGGLVATYGQVVGTFTRLGTAITKAGGLTKALGLAFSSVSLPILAVVAGVIAIGVAIYQLWQTNEAFRQNMISIWENIKIIVGGVIKFIVVLFKFLWWRFGHYLQFAWDLVKVFVRNIIKYVSGFMDIIVGIFTGDGSKIVQGFKKIVSSILDTIVGSIIAIVNFAIRAVNKMIDLVNKVPGIEIGKVGELDYEINWGYEETPTPETKSSKSKAPEAPSVNDSPLLSGDFSGMDDGFSMDDGIPFDDGSVNNLSLSGSASGGYGYAVGGGITINVQQMNVTEKNDIKKVAQELKRLYDAELRAQGGR
jgi:TP901 family phage tail tape measure protein